MYAQCDIEGRQYNLTEGIVDHKKDGHAFESAEIFIKHGSNKQVRKQPRVGTCVLNGNIGQQAGSAWWISSKATQFKLLSIQLQRA
jgi:hypothetical protein